MKLSTDPVWTKNKLTLCVWQCYTHLFNSEMISYFKMQDDTSCAWAWIVLANLESANLSLLPFKIMTGHPSSPPERGLGHTPQLLHCHVMSMAPCSSATSKQCPAITVWQQHCLHPCSRDCFDSFLPEKESRLSWRCLWKHSGVHICRKKTEGASLRWYSGWCGNPLVINKLVEL